MNTVLALMAKVMTAIRGHMTRSEWRISFCKDKESTPLFRSCRSSVWFSKCSIHEDVYIFTTVEFVVDFEETHLINSSDEKYHIYINDNDVTLCIFYATYINISILSKCSYLLVLINKLSCPPGHHWSNRLVHVVRCDTDHRVVQLLRQRILDLHRGFFWCAVLQLGE